MALDEPPNPGPAFVESGQDTVDAGQNHGRLASDACRECTSGRPEQRETLLRERVLNRYDHNAGSVMVTSIAPNGCCFKRINVSFMMELLVHIKINTFNCSVH